MLAVGGTLGHTPAVPVESVAECQVPIRESCETVTTTPIRGVVKFGSDANADPRCCRQ